MDEPLEPVAVRKLLLQILESGLRSENELVVVTAWRV